MKITCERCRAQYDIDDAKIPPSGFRMTCPACTNEMTVKPGTASAAEAPAAGPREISLSSMDDDAIDLPQPVKSAGAAPASLPAAPSVAALAESALADLDFSSINVPAATTSAPPPIALADEPDLPAPVARGAAPQMLRPPGASVPPPRAPHQPDQGIVDLPAPRTRSETPKPVVDTGPASVSIR